MPINYQQQISPQGTPNRKGLEIYTTETIYSLKFPFLIGGLTLYLLSKLNSPIARLKLNVFPSSIPNGIGIVCEKTF